MRILIVGAGGVGGYLAGELTKCGRDVTVMVREKTYEKIKKDGLKIIDVDQQYTVYPKLDVEGVYDVVFVTTKSYDLDDVIMNIRSHVSKESVVVPILNGVSHFERFKTLPAVILKACIYILSNKREDGVIHKKTPLFYLCVEDNEKVRKVFEGCGLKVKFSKDIDYDIWKKYLFISVFATLQSYYMKPTGWIMEHKRDEVERFLEEVIGIASKFGVDLKDEKERVIKQALNIPYESKMSMQIDFENSHKSEVENITGFLAEKSDLIKKYYWELNERTVTE